MVSFFDVAISLRKVSRWRFVIRHRVESLVGGVEIVVSRFSSPLPPGSSWISGRDPLLVVATCNSPEIPPQLNFLCLLRCCDDCMYCLRCLLHRNNNR